MARLHLQWPNHSGFIANLHWMCYACRRGENMSSEFKKLAVGESDFNQVISGNYYYVDKSLFIKDIIDRGHKIILIPRPRRFGKTLNISMLKYFYDCCPETPFTPSPSQENKQPGINNSYKNLFDSLAISNAGREYTDKMGQHPVIFLTFEEIKESNWETCFSRVKKVIQVEYLKHNSKMIFVADFLQFGAGFFGKVVSTHASSLNLIIIKLVYVKHREYVPDFHKKCRSNAIVPGIDATIGCSNTANNA